jgi:soluble lytic murein transglycosylase-like protein
MIIKAAERHDVEVALIKAIIMAESGYNHRAISRKGAVGLMQLMPATANALGVNDPFNPELNVNGGVKYFKKLLIQFNGKLELALAAYNAGSGKVKKYNGIPPFKATHIYIQKVFRYYRYYKDAYKV